MKLDHEAVRALARQRWRVGIALSVVVAATYFSFVLIAAFAKQTAATQIVPGLSIGIALGIAVILLAWGTTWVYVRWADSHMDGHSDGHVRKEEA